MTGTTEKDLLQLRKRLLELAEKSYSRGIYTFTPFLSLSEQQVFHAVSKEVAYAGYGMEGGSPVSDRKIVRFGSVENTGYEEAYPITCIEILPVSPKFAQTLTHRDFLGAVMNLGIERGTVGDIFIKEQGGILFCLQSIAPYLMENLTKVKNTNIKCRVCIEKDVIRGAEPKEVSVTVSSIRIDGIISKLYNISRSQSVELFRAGRIFVNGIMTQNNSYQLKNNDAVTVRGYGKFIFYGSAGETRRKKERINVGIFG